MEENGIMSSINNLILELDNKNSKSNSLIKRNYDWYKRASARNRIWWYIFQLLAFITSITTSILIAFTKSDLVINNTWKITLIVISGISTASISVIGIFKIFELWKIRDEGRFLFNKLKCESVKDYNVLKIKAEPEELEKLYNNIINTVNIIEEMQTQSFLGLFGNKDKNNT